MPLCARGMIQHSYWHNAGLPQELWPQLLPSLNINTAEIEELMKALPGLEYSCAMLIMRKRDFQDTDDLATNIPLLASLVGQWQPGCVRTAGIPFIGAQGKDGSAARASTVGDLRALYTDLAFFDAVVEMSGLPDAVQPADTLRTTGVRLVLKGDNLRSSKQHGTKNFIPAWCEASENAMIHMPLVLAIS